MARLNWSRRLPRPIGYTKPKRGTIATLRDARAYMLAIRAAGSGASTGSLFLADWPQWRRGGLVLRPVKVGE
jgi:hypothetical protein